LLLAKCTRAVCRFLCITAPRLYIGEPSIVMSVYVCLSVCPRTYLENCTSSLHQIVAHLTVARWRYDTLRMDDAISARTEVSMPLQRVTSLRRRAQLTPLLRRVGRVVSQTTACSAEIRRVHCARLGGLGERCSCPAGPRPPNSVLCNSQPKICKSVKLLLFFAWNWGPLHSAHGL